MPKFTRQAKCVNGKRAMCMTKYETQCVNEEVTHNMTEDHPVCRVEMVTKCTKKEDDHDSSKSDVMKVMMKMMKPSLEERCSKYPAMRCRIEKKTVIKTKPETKCQRVPRQFCRKEDCSFKGGDSNSDKVEDPKAMEIMDEALCYYRIQTVREILIIIYHPRKISIFRECVENFSKIPFHRH